MAAFPSTATLPSAGAHFSPAAYCFASGYPSAWALLPWTLAPLVLLAVQARAYTRVVAATRMTALGDGGGAPRSWLVKWATRSWPSAVVQAFVRHSSLRM